MSAPVSGVRRVARGEAGVAALEMIVALPVLLAILAFMVAGARITVARADVLAIAREAARSAVEQPGPEQAASAAHQLATEMAKEQGLDPTRLEIEQDPQRLEPGGTYLVVVQYTVAFSDLPGLGMLPGSVVVGARHQEPIDPNRSFPREGER